MYTPVYAFCNKSDRLIRAQSFISVDFHSGSSYIFTAFTPPELELELAIAIELEFEIAQIQEFGRSSSSDQPELEILMSGFLCSGGPTPASAFKLYFKCMDNYKMIASA